MSLSPAMKQSISKHFLEGKLPPHKIAKKLGISESDVLKFIRENHQRGL